MALIDLANPTRFLSVTEWGVYGVPETFLVGRDGKIAYKLVGPITEANLERALKPEIEKALKFDSSMLN
jgi:cytochrome c biogenesis protein CcmG, thiol:disulfide interchange protein DsbE